MERSLRTVLLVLVPEADPVVGEHRLRMDSAARLGVPAHLTVLFPFLPPADVDDAVIAQLGKLFSRMPAFTHALISTAWFDDDVLWLRSDAEEIFRGLTGSVTAAFPDYRPYDGQFDDVQPHLTVADRSPLAEMQAAEEDIRGRLPIISHAAAVTMLAEQPSGRWERAASFPLG